MNDSHEQNLIDRPIVALLVKALETERIKVGRKIVVINRMAKRSPFQRGTIEE